MTVYLSIIILGIAIFGLSIGVIFNDKPIQGSCGGIGADDLSSPPAILDSSNRAGEQHDESWC